MHFKDMAARLRMTSCNYDKATHVVNGRHNLWITDLSLSQLS